jgi:hypothetical protein
MSDTGGERRTGRAFLAEARRRLAAAHERIRHCVGQLDDGRVWWRPAESMNSVGNILLHLCGNLRQWLVAGVGGAADFRDRPREFAERGPIPRDELLGRLAAVVAAADAALAAADATRLLDARRIQGFDETVLSAVFDCLTHLSGHAQEIVYVTRLQLGEAYRFAWVPATPEQGALPPEAPEGERLAAADAAFEEMPTHPLPVEEPAEETDDAEAPAAPPPGDYLLELEQEFQEDEDRGKL